jgi:peptidoglycan DL-endopeptidase CwlO
MASVRARLGASLGLAVALAVVPVGAAHAAPTPGAAAGPASVASATSVTLPAVGSTGAVRASRAVLHNPLLRGRLIIAIAKRYRGVPYHAGGTTPASGFDCSGYTRYVYGQLGLHLPRDSREQYASTLHLTLGKAVPGDLIFFHSSSGRVYHAAIYAGHGMVWHSPHTGTRVHLERIWTSMFYVGRLRV